MSVENQSPNFEIVFEVPFDTPVYLTSTSDGERFLTRPGFRMKILPILEQTNSQMIICEHMDPKTGESKKVNVPYPESYRDDLMEVLGIVERTQSLFSGNKAPSTKTKLAVLDTIAGAVDSLEQKMRNLNIPNPIVLGLKNWLTTFENNPDLQPF